MKPPNTTKVWSFPNLSLLASVIASFFQIGAQLFALVVIAGTISKAPPRSFAIFEGEYGYDSSSFWDTLPPICFLLLVLALIANWKTTRRKLLLLSLTAYIVGGLLMMFVVEPEFAEIKAIGFRNEIDPELQIRAARWYAMDWLGWAIGFISGIFLLFALMRPAAHQKI